MGLNALLFCLCQKSGRWRENSGHHRSKWLFHNPAKANARKIHKEIDFPTETKEFYQKYFRKINSVRRMLFALNEAFLNILKEEGGREK